MPSISSYIHPILVMGLDFLVCAGRLIDQGMRHEGSPAPTQLPAGRVRYPLSADNCVLHRFGGCRVSNIEHACRARHPGSFAARAWPFAPRIRDHYVAEFRLARVRNRFDKPGLLPTGIPSELCVLWSVFSSHIWNSFRAREALCPALTQPLTSQGRVLTRMTIFSSIRRDAAAMG